MRSHAARQSSTSSTSGGIAPFATIDLRDGEIGVAEQRRGALDPSREQVPVRRDAEGLLEGSREVGRRDAAHAREPMDGPRLVRGGVQPILRAQQAP
jgi:hypothetical protein